MTDVAPTSRPRGRDARPHRTRSGHIRSRAGLKRPGGETGPGEFSSFAPTIGARHWAELANPEPHADSGEDRIADRRSDDGRRRLAEADWNLGAVDKLDVEFRHVADAQQRIGVEVGVLYLTLDEFVPSCRPC